MVKEKVMKMTKETNKKDNRGFSLVELIVVIAIMVVLVAVLAPVFTRYVERSRRATDIQNANSIADSVLTEAASGELTSSSGIANTTNLKSIKSDLVTRGNAVAKDSTFSYEYNANTNTVKVYVTDDTGKTDLTQEDNATAYSNDGTASNDKVD